MVLRFIKETDYCDGKQWDGGIQLLGYNVLPQWVTLKLGLNGETGQSY